MGFSRGPKIVTDDLVLYLDAANRKSYPGTGTSWSDLSGNGLDGTIANSPTFNSSLGTFEFDGVDQYVNLGDVLDFEDSLTHEVWFMRSSNATTNLRLTSKGAGSTGTSNQGFGFFGSNTSINWSTNIGGTRYTISTSISIDTWYCVTGTVDQPGTTQKIYLNGEEKNSTTVVAGSLSSAQSFSVGSYQNTSLYWEGKIALVRTYNKALSAQEVLQNYNALKGRFGL